MEVNLTRLKHIVAVARTGSFSLAAAEEGISQPALSRSIQMLEAQFGLHLFTRGRSGASLTPAGVLAVEQAQVVLHSAREFDRNLHLFGQGKAGRLGVGMGPLMASLLLPRLGASLLVRSPDLKLAARIGLPDQMLASVMDGTIEVIVGNAWQLGALPGVTEERLGLLSLAVVVRAEHPLAKASPLRMRDLDPFPVARAYEHPVGDQVSAAGAFTCENYDILKDLVLRTDCTWLVSPTLICQELKHGSLVRLEVEDLSTTDTQISCVYKTGRPHSPAAAYLIEMTRHILHDLLSVDPPVKGCEIAS